MDKRVILAVAGSGKTTFLISQLDEIHRYLIITFTNNNQQNLRKKIIDKFGYLPTNIIILTYFVFLHSFCYKPFLLFKYKTKGIDYSSTPNKFATGISQFMNKKNRLYSNRIAKLLKIDDVLLDINDRIEKYFDRVLIDEIQDFAGHDFNLLQSITASKVDLLFVGDFYQHTYDTSHDGNVNYSLYKNYNKYKTMFKKMGLVVDDKSLEKSFRCSNSVCNFIQSNIGIKIQSNRSIESLVKYVTDETEIKNIISSNDIIKLFYQKHYCYNCFSSNWGESKGIDHFIDVCVVLNKKTADHFIKNKLSELSPTVKNKLYVACSRARGNLYFITEDHFKK